MRWNTVGSFADHDRKLNLVIGPALRMTDHYRFGWPNHRTRSLKEETHTFNFGNLIAVVNFGVFTRLLEVPPVVNRCAYDLAWVSDWGSELHFPNRDTRLIFSYFSDGLAQAVQFRDKWIELRQWIAKNRQAITDAGNIDNVILSY